MKNREECTQRSSDDRTKYFVMGYLHPAYANVYADYGIPLKLERSNGYLLERSIPNSDMCDAMGCYPIFCCKNWYVLAEDLDELARRGIICVSLVTDPFGPLNEEELRRIFDTVIPFKTHYVADLSTSRDKIISAKRRRSAEKALEIINVELSSDPMRFVGDWLTLQQELVDKHSIKGMKLLNKNAVERLFAVPGVTVLRASIGDVTVGMHIELIQGDVVYGHLASYSSTGRRHGVSAAIHAWEIEYFIGKKKWINWGGGASGIEPGEKDGLTEFKRGFSNAIRQTYFCGKILDGAAYSSLVHKTGNDQSRYFPAYRTGEFS